MCGVNENRWRGAHPLQPAGAGRGGEAGPDGVDVELALRTRPEEGFHGGQCDRRVVGLMLTVQWQEDLGVHPAEALQLDHLAADGDLTAEHRELGVLPGDGGVGPQCRGQQHRHRLGCLLSDHRDGVDRHHITARGGDDAGFLGGDLRQGVAQVLGVVDTDGGDHRDRGVDDVGGVPPPAHAALDDRDVDGRIGECGECHRGENLELTHGRAAVSLRLGIHHLHEWLYLTVGFDVARGADRYIVNGDPLNRRLQVRAGCASRPPVQRRQQRVDHSGH